MSSRIQLHGLTLALTVFAFLGSGVLLSGCGTVAGAGQDISNIGYTVSGASYQVQRDTNLP